jgi:hypothetical protein
LLTPGEVEWNWEKGIFSVQMKSSRVPAALAPTAEKSFNRTTPRAADFLIFAGVLRRCPNGVWEISGDAGPQKNR